jgi:hypothetical protein
MPGIRRIRPACWCPIAASLLLLLFHGQAMADDSTGQVINDLYDAFLQPIRQFGSALVAARVGVGLLGSLVALHVIGAGLSFAAGTIDPFGLAARMLRLALLSALVLATIQRQDWFAAMSGHDTLGRAIEGGFAQIMRWAAVAAELPDTVDPASMIRSVSNTVLTALFKMGEVQVFPAGTSMWKAMTNVTGLMVGLLMWFMCVVAYVVAGAIVLGEAVIADLTIQLALAFAPLMVPWLLFAPLRFLFEAWLRTLLIGGVGFVIAILFCAGMAAFARSADRAMAQVLLEPFVNARLIATFSPILIGSILMILMAGKVMSFASSLLSGGSPGGVSLGDIRGALGAVVQAAAAPARSGVAVVHGAKGLKAGASAAGRVLARARRAIIVARPAARQPPAASRGTQRGGPGPRAGVAARQDSAQQARARLRDKATRFKAARRR